MAQPPSRPAALPPHDDHASPPAQDVDESATTPWEPASNLNKDLSSTLGRFPTDSTDLELSGDTPSASPTARYARLRHHADGGLGQLFVAEDLELHREVALKEIKPEHADNSESRARVVLEAEITGGLEHPGIVPVYGLGSYANGRA